MLFLRVVAYRVHKSVQLRCQLLDNSRNLLLLRLEVLVLLEVLGVLRLELLEYFALARLVLVHLHELLDGVQVVVHGHAIIHDLLLALPDLLKLVELLLDADHRWIVCHVLGASGLRDHGS